MIRLTAIYLLFIATLAPTALAYADTCPIGQAVTAVTLTCATVGTTTPPPVTCTPPKVLANGVCADPPTTPPVCAPPQVLQGGVCVTPPPVSSACPADTIRFSADVARPGTMFTANAGGMRIGTYVVVAINSGTVSSANNNLPKIAAAEYSSAPSTREATLSDKECDFGPQQWGGAKSSGTSVTVPFAIGSGANFGYYPIMEIPNKTYYFSIRNGAGASCGGGFGSCDMIISLTNPNMAAASAAISKALAVPANAAVAKSAIAKKAAK